jgi:hypothetical protein
VLGALNDYLGKEVVVSVRSAAAGGFADAKLALYGVLRKQRDGPGFVVGPEGDITGSFSFESGAIEAPLQSFRDEDLGSDHVGFEVAGLLVTIGLREEA